MKYTVVIRETCERSVEVEAVDCKSAIEEARRIYYAGCELPEHPLFAREFEVV